jgi:hypothetical protein
MRKATPWRASAATNSWCCWPPGRRRRGRDHGRADGGRQGARALAETSRSTASPTSPRPASASPAAQGPGQTAHDLLREADTAMYRAKAAGRNGVALFETTMQAEVEQRLTLERDLAPRSTAASWQMHLQLQVDRTAAGRRRTADALAPRRRQHGAAGRVHPDGRGSTGLIVPLGQWACARPALPGCAWTRPATAAAVGQRQPEPVPPGRLRRAGARRAAETGAPAAS